MINVDASTKVGVASLTGQQTQWSAALTMAAAMLRTWLVSSSGADMSDSS